MRIKDMGFGVRSAYIFLVSHVVGMLAVGILVFFLSIFPSFSSSLFSSWYLVIYISASE